MPGVEIGVERLSLPGVSEFSRIVLTFAVGKVWRSTGFPFKLSVFENATMEELLSVSVMNGEKLIYGADVDLGRFKSKRTLKVNLSESFRTPDSKRQGFSEAAELFLTVNECESFKSDRLEGRKAEESLDMLSESYKSRQELQLSIEETTQQLLEMIKTQDVMISQIQQEKKEAAGRVSDLKVQLDNEKALVSSLYLKNQELESQILAYRSNELTNESLDFWCNEVKTETDQYVLQQNSLIEKIRALTTDYDSRCSDYQSNIETLVNDKLLLMKNIESLQRENHQLKRENNELTSELLKLKAKLIKIEGEIIYFSSWKSKEGEMTDRLKANEGLIAKLKDELKKSAEEFKECIARLTVSKSKVIEENKQILQELRSNQKLLIDKESEVSIFLSENKRLHAEIAALEQHLCVKEDKNQIIDDLNKCVKTLREDKWQNQSTIEAQNQKLLERQQKIEELSELVKEKSDEIEDLMTEVLRLQSCKNYIPVQNDPIDIALADYINTLEKPLEVPFAREEEGIYTFGTKRIFVKLEKGKVIIRVGGGFMHVTEFIDVYTESELDKFARQKSEMAQKVRLSLYGKLSEDKNSPRKFSQCFGVQKKSPRRRSTTPVSYSTSYT